MISVIVPVYNVENYLIRCVKSLINQTYKDLEIILVDDGSTDHSGILCDEIQREDNRISVIHKKNGGLSDARNRGIEVARGEYISFIDSDDWIDLRTYEVLLKNMIDTDSDISDIDSIVVDKEMVYLNKPEVIEVLEGKQILIDYFLKDKVSCCRKLYKREVVGDVRFPVGKINEDIITNFEFLCNSKRLVKSSLKMYYYYSNPNSITGNKFKKKDLDLIYICEELMKKASFDNDIKYLANIKYGTSFYSLLGRYICYSHDNFPEADIVAKDLRNSLKKQFKLLMESNVSLKKKVIICIMCLCDPLLLNKLYTLVKSK